MQPLPAWMAQAQWWDNFTYFYGMATSFVLAAMSCVGVILLARLVGELRRLREHLEDREIQVLVHR